MADIRNEIAAIQVATSGSAIRIALIDALNAINSEQVWEIDDTPTQNSNNLAKSGGIYFAIQNAKKKTRLSSISLSTVWSGSEPYYQIVTITGATSTSKIDIQLDASSIQQLMADGVVAMWVENDNGTFKTYCVGAYPTVSLTVQCTISDVI